MMPIPVCFYLKSWQERWREKSRVVEAPQTPNSRLNCMFDIPYQIGYSAPDVLFIPQRNLT